MTQIRIFYDWDFSKWIDEIERVLNQNAIIHSKELSATICRSLNDTIKIYLREWGYRPRDTNSWRKNLVSRLKKQGLELIIESNKILWLYLEHFTDLTDYSKTFDIKINIKDWNLASPKVELITVRHNSKGESIKLKLKLDSVSDLYRDIDKKLERIQQYSLTHGFINDLVDVLSYLAKRSELNEKE